jgi:hypothetical protein
LVAAAVGAGFGGRAQAISVKISGCTVAPMISAMTFKTWPNGDSLFDALDKDGAFHSWV